MENNNETIIKTNKLFPIVDNVDYNKLKTDYIGEFSITKPDDADIITNIILNHIKRKNIIITDCTAGLGGNTISFSRTFDIVKSIEINKLRYELLKNNIETYNLKNVELINNNFLMTIFDKYQDVIFIDPPWGGKGYKKRKNIKLDINNIQIENICNMIKKQKVCELIVLKLPLNYDINFLKSKISNVECNIINKMYIITIRI